MATNVFSDIISHHSSPSLNSSNPDFSFVLCMYLMCSHLRPLDMLSLLPYMLFRKVFPPLAFRCLLFFIWQLSYQRGFLTKQSEIKTTFLLNTFRVLVFFLSFLHCLIFNYLIFHGEVAVKSSEKFTFPD